MKIYLRNEKEISEKRINKKYYFDLKKKKTFIGIFESMTCNAKYPSGWGKKQKEIIFQPDTQRC